MSAFTKIAGVVAGLSTVAVISVAVAQSEPPDPNLGKHPIAAGQQSSHITPMGETGVLVHAGEIRTATLIRQPEVAVITPEPAAAPEVVAVAPAPEPAPTTAMGAGPAPEPAPAEPAPVARADRN